jgi:hypothetical protein
MDRDERLEWLLSGDVAIQYQTQRDLLGMPEDRLDVLRGRIASEGWGKSFLDRRKDNCQWGRGFYMPKWTSTHYTLMDLMGLGLPRDNPLVSDSLKKYVEGCLYHDGGINVAKTVKYSDVCLTGMVLSLGAYFFADEEKLKTMVDYLLSVVMDDGGWNCNHLSGAKHSSMHSTCLLYTSPSPRDRQKSRMPSSA